MTQGKLFSEFPAIDAMQKRETEKKPVEPLYRKDQETEKAGAQAAKISADSIRGRIAELLKERAMTDDELEVEWEERFGLPDRRFFGNTLRRRRHELKKLGIVVDTGKKRESRCGVLNIVWGVKQ